VRQAHGHAAERAITRSINQGDIESALRVIEASHSQILQDRATLDAVESSLHVLLSESVGAQGV
jgi:hypothetical protein